VWKIFGLDTRTKQDKDCDKDGKTTEYHGLPMVHAPTDDLRVTIGDLVQELLDIVKDRPVQLTVLRLVAQHS